MVYVYIIKSTKENGYYIGILKDISDRLNKHNKGEVYSTRNRRPFVLIYSEAY